MALPYGMRVRGEPIQNTYNVSTGVLINPGDHVWWNGTTLKPVGSVAGLVEAWSSESQARRNARARYAGVAAFSMTADDKFARTVMIESNCVFGLKVVSATYSIGDLLGFDKDAAGNYLHATRLKRVTNPADAIAFVTKETTAGATEVEAMLLSAYDLRSNLDAQIRSIHLFASATLYAAGGNLIDGFTFGAKVRLLNLKAIVTKLTAGASIATISNGVNALDDTLTVPTAQAAGVVISQDLEDANSYHDFEHDDVLKIALDATPTDGEANYTLEYMIKPLVG